MNVMVQLWKMSTSAWIYREANVNDHSQIQLSTRVDSTPKRASAKISQELPFVVAIIECSDLPSLYLRLGSATRSAY